MKGLHSFSKGAPTAPPVLLIHGLLGSARNLHSLATALAEKGFHVVAYDQRGHGHSPWADDYSLGALAGDVFEIMDANGFDRAHLVGHSLGARVSLAASALDPARVLSLTMLDAGLRVHDEHLATLHAIIDPLAESYPSRTDAERALAEHTPAFRQFLLSSLRSDREPPHAVRWTFDLAGARQELLKTVQSDQTEAWKSLRCPALVVRGERSEALLPSDLHEMRRLVPHAEVVTVPNADHWIHVDNFPATLDAVARFLMEHK